MTRTLFLSPWVFLLACLLPGCAARQQPAAVVAQETAWFEDLADPLPLTGADLEALVLHAAAIIRGDGAEPPALPAHVMTDSAPRVVFLSITEGNRTATIFHGRALGLPTALASAAEAARAEFAGKTVWLKLDVVRDVRPAKGNWAGAPLGVRVGVEGIALGRPAEAAALPEQIEANNMLTRQGRLVPGKLGRANADPGATNDPAEAAPADEPKRFLFTTDAALLHAGRTISLRRDGWRDLSVPLRQDELAEAVTEAAEYLTRVVGPDGKFIYAYDPAERGDGQEYNIVRHAGTIMAMMQAYEAGGRRDKDLLNAARRAVEYLKGAIEEIPGKPGVAAVVENDSIKLGGNGLGILAIAYYTRATGDRQYLPAAQSLARWCLSVQSKPGAFTVHSQRFSDGRVERITSVFFAGEAIYGLCILHDVDPEGPWLDAADRAVRWLISGKDKLLNDMAVYEDHWLLYALDHVNQRRPDRSFYRHAKKMVPVMLKTQIGQDAKDPNWAGAFGRPPNSNNTATRVEGLSAAWNLARAAGDEAGAAKIRAGIEAAVRYLLRQQFSIPLSMYYANPAKLAGGFRAAPSMPVVRIDTVQHNISALILAQEVLFGALEEQHRPGAQASSFDELGAARRWNPDECAALLQHAIWKVGFNGRDAPALPETIVQDVEPRVVFLSACDGETVATVFRGHGLGAAAAARDAAKTLRANYQVTPRMWLRLDIVAEVRRSEASWAGVPLGLRVGVDGVAFGETVYLPEALKAASPLTPQGRLGPEALAAAQAAQPEGGPFIWHAFTTDAACFDGESITPVARAGEVPPPATPEAMRQAVLLAAEYFLNAIGPDGRFVYQYHPFQREPNDDYNIVRHAGSVWGFMQAYALTRDERFLKGGALAMDYLFKEIHPVVRPRGPGPQTVLLHERQAVLGGNAIAGLALVHYIEATGDKTRLEDLRKLARWMVSCQEPSGRFNSWWTHPQNEPLRRDSILFPDEAIYALLRIHAIDPNDQWLNCARRGMDYLIDVRDRALPELQRAKRHWSLYALDALYRYVPEEKYADHAIKLADGTVKNQQRGPERPEWVGGFNAPPGGNPAGSSTEALCAAYRLATAAGRTEEAKRYLEAIRLANAFQLTLQYTPANAMYYPAPRRLIGGFRTSLTHPDVRIDTVQHNLAGLLAAYEIVNSGR